MFNSFVCKRHYKIIGKSLVKENKFSDNMYFIVNILNSHMSTQKPKKCFLIHMAIFRHGPHHIIYNRGWHNRSPPRVVLLLARLLAVISSVSYDIVLYGVAEMGN